MNPDHKVLGSASRAAGERFFDSLRACRDFADDRAAAAVQAADPVRPLDHHLKTVSPQFNANGILS